MRHEERRRLLRRAVAGDAGWSESMILPRVVTRFT